MKKTAKVNGGSMQAKYLIREDNYYLFSDLPQILSITEEVANGIKGFIMKEFWHGNLTHGLWSFHKQYPVSVNIVGLEDKILLEREALRSLLPVFHGGWDKNKINVDESNQFVDLRKNVYTPLAQKPWEFYQALIDEELENKRTYESQRERYISLLLLYLPNLAIDIKDLKSLLKKKGLTELIMSLPKRQKKKRSYKVMERNEIIKNRWKEIRKTQSNDSEIARIISKEMGLKLNLRSLISKKKKQWA